MKSFFNFFFDEKKLKFLIIRWFIESNLLLHNYEVANQVDGYVLQKLQTMVNV